MPAIVFILLTFAAPIASVLYRAVDGGTARLHLPRAAAALAEWNGDLPIPDAVAVALAADLRAVPTTTVAEVARD
ncbi:MAG: ABC transporter permease, partial [Alphaproteobacteria bacterium]|nr:ABC transporter permease [Alphaproteobacteria bacterium]